LIVDFILKYFFYELFDQYYLSLFNWNVLYHANFYFLAEKVKIFNEIGSINFYFDTCGDLHPGLNGGSFLKTGACVNTQLDLCELL